MVVRIYDNKYCNKLNDLQVGNKIAVQDINKWGIYEVLKQIDNPDYNISYCVQKGYLQKINEVDPLKYNIITDKNPTTANDYEVPGVIWYNYKSGETFKLQIKRINDLPVWVGDKGTIVCDDTTSILDIFNDGSCIALYELNGNFYDTGGVFNLKAKREVSFKEGLVGKCAYFNRWSFLYNEELGTYFKNNGISEASVSLWIKPLKQTRDQCLFHFSYNGRNNLAVWLRRRDLGLFATINNKTLPVTTKLTENKWFHIVLTSQGKLYLDGKLIKDYAISNDMTLCNLPFLLGADRDSARSINDYFYGCVEEVRIFNKVVNDIEVQTLYNEIKRIVNDI